VGSVGDAAVGHQWGNTEVKQGGPGHSWEQLRAQRGDPGAQRGNAPAQRAQVHHDAVLTDQDGNGADGGHHARVEQPQVLRPCVQAPRSMGWGWVPCGCVCTAGAARVDIDRAHACKEAACAPQQEGSEHTHAWLHAQQHGQFVFPGGDEARGALGVQAQPVVGRDIQEAPIQPRFGGLLRHGRGNLRSRSP